VSASGKDSGDVVRQLLATPEGVLRVLGLATRVSSDLGAASVRTAHGVVAATWTADLAAQITQSATYNFYITDITCYISTDPTAEVAVQEIPLLVLISDVTDDERRWAGNMSIPSNTHMSFNTPIKIPKGHNFRTDVYLGGATDLDMYFNLNGFESED